MLLFCKNRESQSVHMNPSFVQRKQEVAKKLTADVLVYHAVPELNVTYVNVSTSVVLTRISSPGQAGPHIRLGKMSPHLVTLLLFAFKQAG